MYGPSIARVQVAVDVSFCSPKLLIHEREYESEENL